MTETEIELLKNKAEINSFFELFEITKNKTENEKKLFEKISSVAIDKENWNYVDEISGCKITFQRLKKEFNMSDDFASLFVKITLNELKKHK